MATSATSPTRSRRGATAVVAIGEARPLIPRRSAACAVLDAPDMCAAVRTAFALAQPGGTVVLAPACSSFDMFADYAERGRVFKQEVARLPGGMERARVSSEQSSVRSVR